MARSGPARLDSARSEMSRLRRAAGGKFITPAALKRSPVVKYYNPILEETVEVTKAEQNNSRPSRGRQISGTVLGGWHSLATGDGGKNKAKAAGSSMGHAVLGATPGAVLTSRAKSGKGKLAGIALQTSGAYAGQHRALMNNHRKGRLYQDPGGVAKASYPARVSGASTPDVSLGRFVPSMRPNRTKGGDLKSYELFHRLSGDKHMPRDNRLQRYGKGGDKAARQFLGKS